MNPRTRTLLSWALWLATMGCCVAGLVVALLIARPLTAQVLLEGALFAFGFPVGFATVGLVLTLRRPANPIGWLYAASALTWSLIIPLGPWIDQLARDQRPLPLIAKLSAMAEVTVWAPAIALGVTLPALLVPDGRLRSRRWRWSRPRRRRRPGHVRGRRLPVPGSSTDTAVPVRQPARPAGPPRRGGQGPGRLRPGPPRRLPAGRPALRDPAFRASRGVERQQLRWVAAGAAIAMVAISVPLGDRGAPGSTRWRSCACR